MMNHLSIIIPTLNRIDTLNITLKQLEQSSRWPDEVIIVDQSSSVKIAEAIKSECHDSKLPIIYYHSNIPSSVKARNIGMNLAKGDIVVFMDDDLSVKTDTLKNLCQLFCDNTVSLVGGLDKTTNNPNSLFSYIFSRAIFSKRKIGHMSNGIFGRFPVKVKGIVPTEWAMGFFFAIRLPLAKKWGISFDEHFQSYSYAEDLDFTYGYFKKASSEGLRCIFSDSIIVNHRFSQEYRIPSRGATYMYFAHRKYIQHKYGLDNFKGESSYLFSTIGDLFYRILHHESIRDMFDSLIFIRKNKKMILNGEFKYNEFKEYSK